MKKRKIIILTITIIIISAILFLPTIETCWKSCEICTDCLCIGEHSPVLWTNMKRYSNSCFACLGCHKYFWKNIFKKYILKN